MRSRTRLLLRVLHVLCGGAVFLVAASDAHAQLRRPRAEVTPIVEPLSSTATSARVGLKVSLPEGLHTQSDKPRDPNLIPTVLTVDAPAGVTVEEIVWPPSTDLKQEGQDQALAVFEREFIVGVKLRLAKPAAALTIPAHLRYQACDANLCYAPATADVEWKLEPPPPGAAGVLTESAKTLDTIKWGTGARPTGDAATPQASAPPSGGGSTSGTNDAELIDRFAVAGTAGGYQGTGEFLTFIRNAENGVKPRGMFEGRGPLAILLLVLVGGLALNLTPCVLPMIPINLAIIGAGGQAASRGRGFLLGSAYGAAMAVVYGALGLIVILTAGTFGTINSSPWFNLAIAVLFVVLGLAMFDVLLIDFSKYSTRFSGGGSRGSVVLAFSMGAIAALLAGACVAPVVIQVVLFSSNLYATGTPIALALPFCLGLGMAIPWPIAGAGIAALPKPGMWMVRVKQAFGVFIIATALYYGWESYSLFANRWVDPALVASSVDEQVKAGWYPSLADGLAAAERERKPVLIDMWATWCKNCLVMDRTTLASDDVKTALAGYVKIKYQCEDPDAEPGRSILQKFSAPGLPAYAILKPKS